MSRRIVRGGRTVVKMPICYNITTNSASTTQVRFLAPKNYDSTDIYMVNGGLRQLKQVDGNPIVHGWVTGAPLVFNLGEDGISMYMDINDVGGGGEPVTPYSELIYYMSGTETTTEHGISDIDNDLNFRVNKLSNDTDITSSRYGVIKYFDKDIPEVSNYVTDAPDAEFYHVFDTENYRVFVAGRYYPPSPVNNVIITNTTTGEQVYNGLASTETDAIFVTEYDNNIYIIGGYAKYDDGGGAGDVITSNGQLYEVGNLIGTPELGCTLLDKYIFGTQYYMGGMGTSVIDLSNPTSPQGVETTPKLSVTQALEQNGIYYVIGHTATGYGYKDLTMPNLFTYVESGHSFTQAGYALPSEFLSVTPITTKNLKNFVFLHVGGSSSDSWIFDSVLVTDTNLHTLYEIPITMTYGGQDNDIPEYITKASTRVRYWYDYNNNVIYISILGVMSDDHYENYAYRQYKINL